MKYVVATVVVLLSIIIVPNLLRARDRSAQQRTEADIRTAASAWEARASDRNSYLVGRPGRVPYEDLRRVLEPTYVKHLPGADGLGTPFEFVGSDQEYSIRAYGSDHRRDATIIP